jgi:hypothetical protein
LPFFAPLQLHSLVFCLSSKSLLANLLSNQLFALPLPSASILGTKLITLLVEADTAGQQIQGNPSQGQFIFDMDLKIYSLNIFCPQNVSTAQAILSSRHLQQKRLASSIVVVPGLGCHLLSPGTRVLVVGHRPKAGRLLTKRQLGAPSL